METIDLDAIVIGAGPGGSTAAARLAVAGARVAVVEKSPLPRYKTCGGGVVGRALRWAQTAVTASEESRAHGARLTFSDIRGEYRLQEERPLVHLVMRAQFDQQLLLQAQRQGAQVFDDCRVLDAERNGVQWRIETPRRRLQAPIVIAADGVHSRMARAAGWPSIQHCAPALEWEIRVDDDSMRRVADEVRFDFDSSLRGYAWVFPKKQQLSVGVLSTRRGARDLSGKLLGYLEQRRLVPRHVDKHAWMIPLQPRAATLARDGVFLVGDAAGLVDPVTCEGISAALWSGDLAGRCLQAAGLDPQTATALYQEALQADLLLELLWARRLARVLYGPLWIRQFLFARFGQAFCEAMGSIISGRQTYRSLLSRPGSLRRLCNSPVPPHRIEAGTDTLA